MKILVTNDDGIAGDGLYALKQNLRAAGHDVLVIAPHVNRSGVSHGLNLDGRLELKKIAADEYSYAGLPADCVIAAVTGTIFPEPDVIVSGINRGANLGTDTIYSGTVGAARQASLFGFPGIAVSLAADEYSDSAGTWKYEALAQFVAGNLEKLVSFATDDCFLNINAGSADRYSGACFTVLSRRHYNDTVKIESGAADSPTYGVFVGGDITSTVECGRNNPPEGILPDEFAVKKGLISISCVYTHPAAFVPENIHSPLFRIGG